MMRASKFWPIAAAMALSCYLAPIPARSESDAMTKPFELLKAQTLTSGISIQGRLLDDGTPPTSLYDLQLRLFTAVAAGSQVGVTVLIDNQAVVDGLFTVEVDFGDSLFGGDARWLEIGVRPGASVAAYELLSPRTKLSSTPQSLSLPNVYTDPGSDFVGIGRNFRISGNEVFGMRRQTASGEYGGMYVETSDPGGWPFYGYATNGNFRAWSFYRGDSSWWQLYNAGVRLTVPNSGGLRIHSSADYSLVILNSAGSDGLRVYETGDDAIQIGSDPDYSNYGVYIPSPGVSVYGLWPNTSDAAGQWALFTVDNIEAGNVAASAFSMVARVTGPDALVTGDVVAVASATDPIPGAVDRLPLVRRADAQTWSGLVGVVDERMAYKLAPGKEAEGEMSMQSEPGPAVQGDYVLLIVYGVTDVNIDPASTISTGQRLTASDEPGRARALATRIVEGMAVSESAPSIGIALETPARGATKVPVFVTLK